MPLYDFECRACGESFEDLIRDADTSREVVCQRCGSTDVERQISSFYAAATGGSSRGAPSPSPGGHGCGAGSCGCH